MIVTADFGRNQRGSRRRPKIPALAAQIVLVHEFAGDCRSWEHQLRYFATNDGLKLHYEEVG